MKQSSADRLGERPAFEVIAPRRQTLPLVLASPHSGTYYPPSFRALSKLDDQTLRRSEDTFVDELFETAPDLGAPLLRAVYPRAFLDLNREPYELDPEMFSDPLPPYVNTSSPRVAAGLGTLAKVVGGGTAIYRDKIPFAEAATRIETLYRPYHHALSDLVEATREAFGYCILLDCHSMPSASHGNPRFAAEVVLGDRHGQSCASKLTEAAARVLSDGGMRVGRNMPYAGGFTTSHYGRPKVGIHALQIELSRALYMHENSHERTSGFDPLKTLLADLVSALAAVPERFLKPRALR